MATDDATEIWVTQQRETVVAYLAKQQCCHTGVGDWPAFHVEPYVALWAVQSATTPGAIGWWAISGDLPTDYMTNRKLHPRYALRHFSDQWRAMARAMRRGQQLDGVNLGSPNTWPTLAPLLEARANILEEWATDNELWVEDDAP